MFADLQGLAKYSSASKEITETIKEYENSQFDKWQGNIQRALQSNEKAKYQLSGQLMQFDYENEGILRVNFSEKLLTLIKDVRILAELGFKTPKGLAAITENAKKFYREGVKLKKVAVFYNSMGNQMIECQKPMMLDKAQQFEKVIKNPRGGKRSEGYVTWNDPIEIENYTREVDQMANVLIEENRRLRKVHNTVIDQIVELMNVDLLKNRNVWKDNMIKIRKTIETATKGKDPQLCALWLRHLDYQLYKALEHQYQMGLESLNENLTEIQADLVFKGQ